MRMLQLLRVPARNTSHLVDERLHKVGEYALVAGAVSLAKARLFEKY